MIQRQINEKIDFLQDLKVLTEAYAEIASSRMLKVRGSVLSAREFLDSLNEIFQEVRASYRQQVLELARSGRGPNKLTFLAHNGKTVAVFLSANTGLYGDIMQKTFREFAKEVSDVSGVEATLVGRAGLSLFLSRFVNRPYTYFDYPDYGGQKEKLAEVIRHLVQYEEIHVHYGKFKTLISQEPALFDISAETPLKNESSQADIVKYIFEPTLESILMFFETEMFTSVFEQALSESQLAKHASRMLAMDRANQNIKESLKEASVEKLKAIHLNMNKKQQAAVSGLFARSWVGGFAHA